MKLENIKDIVIIDRIDYDQEKRNFYLELKRRDGCINELRNRIYKTRDCLLHYESYIPEDDIPEIVDMLDGE